MMKVVVKKKIAYKKGDEIGTDPFEAVLYIERPFIPLLLRRFMGGDGREYMIMRLANKLKEEGFIEWRKGRTVHENYLRSVSYQEIIEYLSDGKAKLSSFLPEVAHLARKGDIFECKRYTVEGKTRVSYRYLARHIFNQQMRKGKLEGDFYYLLVIPPNYESSVIKSVKRIRRPPIKKTEEEKGEE